MRNRILFITATHGDEQFAIEVMSSLEKRFDKEKYNYDWIVGNPNACKLNKRFTESDLNRIAPGDITSNVFEERRAAEIIQIAQQFDYVIDIHGSVSNCGIVKIIPYPSFENLFLAATISAPRNVIWYSKKSLLHGPLVQFLKKPAIEIECGPKDSVQIRDSLTNIISEILENNFMFHGKNLFNYVRTQEFYYVYDRYEGNHDKSIVDFVETNDAEDYFYPFLANQYEMVKCYKMKKAKIEDFFLF